MKTKSLNNIKISGVLLSCVLFLQPVSVMAANDNPLHELGFEDIKQEVFNRNPVIEGNRNEVNDGIDQIDDNLDALKQQEQMFDQMSTSIINGFKTIKQDSVSKDSLVNIIHTFPQPLPMDINQLSDPVTVLKSDSNPLNVMNLIGFVIGKDTNGADMWFLLDMTAPENLDLTAGEEGSSDTVDVTAILDYINFSSLKNYQFQIQSIESQITNLEKQSDESWRSKLQVEMGNDQMVWGVQQMFLTYNDLKQQLNNLQINREIQQKQIDLDQLKLELGWITKQQLDTNESKLQELDLAISQLQDNLNSLLGNLNVSLGQDFNTPLTIEATPDPDMNQINGMNYDKDLEQALTESYTVRLEENNDQREQQERQVKLDFDSYYEDVKEKVMAWNREKDKLMLEQGNYNQAQKSYELGLISQLFLDKAKLSIQTQQENVEKAETNLVKAFTAYQWLLNGMKVN